MRYWFVLIVASLGFVLLVLSSRNSSRGGAQVPSPASESFEGEGGELPGQSADAGWSTHLSRSSQDGDPGDEVDELPAEIEEVFDGLDQDRSMAVKELSELINKGGTEFLRQAIRVTKRDRQLQGLGGHGGLTENESLLSDALAMSYLEGGIRAPLGEILDALEGDPDSPLKGLVAAFTAKKIVTDQQHPENALRDLFENGATESLSPMHYSIVARRAADRIGYESVLRMIPDPLDDWFGSEATGEVVSEWLAREPVEASTFISGLEPSGLRDAAIYQMVRYLAGDGDYERALAWGEAQTNERLRDRGLKIVRTAMNTRPRN